MTTPRRVRVGGDLFHPRIPDGAVYVGRAGPNLRRSPFHNPFRAGHPIPTQWAKVFNDVERVRDRAHAVDLFRLYARWYAGYDLLGTPGAMPDLNRLATDARWDRDSARWVLR